MLNKEQTRKAEQLRDQLAPLWVRAGKLADKWTKSNKERRTARDRALMWLYIGAAGGCPYGEQLPEEERKQAQELRATDSKKWHEMTDALFIKETEADNQERADWFNYSNYCRYIGAIIGENLRIFGGELVKGQNMEQLGEIITPKEPKDYHPHTLRASIRFDCSFSDSLCLVVSVSGGGSCGAWFSDYYYIKKEPSDPQQVAAPKTMTAKQYADRVAKLNNYTEQAKTIQKEQKQKAKEWGLLDACELLKYPTTEKYRK